MAVFQLLSDEVLMSAYQKANELELEADFIDLLKQELLRRDLATDHIGGDSHHSQE